VSSLSGVYNVLLLGMADQQTCTKCDIVLTVKHIFLDCPELRDVILHCFFVERHFESVDNQNIIGFIKDAHFCHQL